jgi:DNA-binding transcriptional LysR family regulator
LHPLAGTARASLPELRSCEWLIPPADVPARALFDRVWSDAERAPPIAHVASRSATLTLEMVRQRGLLAVVPFAVLRPAIESGALVVVDSELEDELAPIGVMWHSKDLGEAAALLLDALRAERSPKAVSTRARPEFDQRRSVRARNR